MKTLAELVMEFKKYHPDAVKTNVINCNPETINSPIDNLTKSGKKAFFKWASIHSDAAHQGMSFKGHLNDVPWTELSDTQKLKYATIEALQEMTEVRVRDVAYSIGLTHVASDDVRVMCENLLKRYPDYRMVMMLDHPDQVASAFMNATLTSCEYED